ncbi:MAG TPA: hypothetical protein VMT86_14765 [Bryobacteraceae bacterium]|nr:hypothetical protein [Bryobacteraceae bacterium]
MQKLKLLAGSFLTALFLFPALIQAQSISIVSGNGQLVCEDCPLNPQKWAPMVVQVNDAAGAASPNTTVTWTVTQPGVPVVTATSVTNAAGQASYTFTPQSFFTTTYFFSTTITAAALGQSVQFTETSGAPYSASGTAPVTIVLSTGSLPALTGTDGQTLTSMPIQVTVTGFYGGLSGIAVTMQATTNSTGLTVGCATQAGQQPGTVLTNSSGIATCTPVLGNAIGKGNYSLSIGGGFGTFNGGSFTITGGAAAIIKILAGNNQTVSSGVKAPVAMLVQVTDLGGNPSSGTALKWAVTQGTATLSSVGTSTLSNGYASAVVTPTAGPVKVTVSLVSAPTVQAVFTINVTTVVTALTVVSGSGQQAKENAAFADPLIVQVNDNTTPVANATVNFVVTSGSATLSAASATSNTQGQAQVTATAGATAGPVVITASVASTGTTYSQVFNLTVIPPGPVITAIVNAAGYQSQFVSPCSLATVYGSGFADGIQGAVTAFLGPQTIVAGLTVQFGATYAPILDVVNIDGQESLSVQVPCEATPGTVPMTITADGAASQPFNVTVSTYSPGIFGFVDTDGATRAVLVRPDGSFASLANPVHLGETIRMYVTGLGQTTPALFTNEFDPLVCDSTGENCSPQVLPVNAQVVVGVNNNGVLVLSATYAYGMVGVYEVQFQVPQDTATGNSQPFAVALYQGTDLLFGNGSLIAIAP